MGDLGGIYNKRKTSTASQEDVDVALSTIYAAQKSQPASPTRRHYRYNQHASSQDDRHLLAGKIKKVRAIFHGLKTNLHSHRTEKNTSKQQKVVHDIVGHSVAAPTPVAVEPSRAKKQHTHKKTKTSLFLRLSSLQKNTTTLIKNSKRKQKVAALTLMLVVAAVSVFATFSSKPKTATNTPASTPSQQSSESNKSSGNVAGAKPDYSIVTPTNTPVDDSIKYNPELKLTTYSYKYRDTDLVVSQQKLTEAQASDPKFLIGVKDTFEANIEIDTTKGKVYVYNKIEKNQHVAIFVYRGLLIFIQSPALFTNTDWTTVVNAMQ